ncbi:biotin/lipoyl-binding carrier protein [Afifella sp. IM 167]|uniref:biotin/lipoyl-binding carrier protein n=1 Tax=Afifella sp. IM 167 TaxID=2033586 RepID=UPI001CC93089|nr:biotin/lipoyl-binding carrier protein [Afifella sp. IM 167]MBZ8134792.1 acetyl-CoA carboxylase biotin carboxyl carrier protein subunit [Afifella sp. IM 167]
MPSKNVVSEIAGSVWKIEKKAGDTVEAEETIVILESMKMEIPIASPIAGKVASLAVTEGDMVDVDQLIAVVEG